MPLQSWSILTDRPLANSIMPEPSRNAVESSPSTPHVQFPSNGQALPPDDLEAALQLLVERAQYITGATGAALALALGAEMVCRASAGSCAPPVGARLQVSSGLTGESVARKQLLRCDNAENDPRVNIDTCRELGIASIVVLPLLSSTGEVRGLFELFSDHAYAFEERDLIALERMAELTRTALDLAEKSAIIVPRRPERVLTVEAKEPEQHLHPVPEESAPMEVAVPNVPPLTELPETPAPRQSVESAPQSPISVPESMRLLHKCSSCGFPVSEGRTLCVDCEEKQRSEPGTSEDVPTEFVPSFGFTGSEVVPEESWLTNHVNILAIVVLILSILVAIVVFR